MLGQGRTASLSQTSVLPSQPVFPPTVSGGQRLRPRFFPGHEWNEIFLLINPGRYSLEKSLQLLVRIMTLIIQYYL